MHNLDTSSSTVSALTAAAAATSLGTKPRWTASSSISGRRNVNSIYNQSIGSSSMSHIRNSYEAEDISTYDRTRTIGNSTSSLCGIGGTSSSSVTAAATSRYFSPPGTSYTIVERSHSPHYYFNSSGDTASGGGKSRAFYLDSLKQNGQKKRPISPERMFPITSSSSTPSSYHHLLTNGRNSPPVTSSSHQIYHRGSGRDRTMVTRTVTMSRDQQPDGSHGFGICVKGGRETGECITFYFRH